MSNLNRALMYGAVGAAALYAARAFDVPGLGGIVHAQSPAKIATLKLPLPALGGQNGFGYEWAILPAALGYWLAR